MWGPSFIQTRGSFPVTLRSSTFSNLQSSPIAQRNHWCQGQHLDRHPFGRAGPQVSTACLAVACSKILEQLASQLAGKPHGNIYSRVALDGCLAALGSSRCNWAWSMFKAIRATG